VGNYSIQYNMPSKYMKMTLSKKNQTLVPPKPVAFLSKFQIIDDLTKVPLFLPFITDMGDVRNQIAACIHRAGREMVEPDKDEMRLFVRYAKAFIEKHLKPLTDAEVPSFDDWLERTPYPGSRRKALAKLRNEIDITDCGIADSECFIKWEFYSEPKCPRGIYSYSDESKVLLGPLQHAIDKKLFALKYFVKGSVPTTWPKRMLELFGTNPVMETDFSSFEAHHRGAFSEIVFFWMKFMSDNLTDKDHYQRLVQKMVLGTNKMKFTKITTTVDQRLMSGAMWTSSSNGLLNLLIMSYLNLRSATQSTDVDFLLREIDTHFVGLVEGDDGICRYNDIPKSLIKKLGLELKFEKAEFFGEASFCGIVCDPKELLVLTNPLKILRNFFVLPSKFEKATENNSLAMLRAKALSYKYSYNDNPIIGALCQRICDLTASINVNAKMVQSTMSSWYSNYVEQSCKEQMWMRAPNVSLCSRLIVERRFQIPVSMQLEMERIIGESDGVFELNLRPFMTVRDFDHALDFTESNGCWSRPEHERVPLVDDVLTADMARKAKSKCSRVDNSFVKSCPNLSPDSGAIQYMSTH
jgi:hypothetical protein